MGTKEYYEENAKSFIEDTLCADMHVQYESFLKFMPKKGKILDLGCGSGRDSIYFQNIGYDVLAVDPIDEFLDHTKKLGVKNVLKLTAEEIDFENEFDGIWASASLLHVSSKDLNEVLKKCSKALKKNGVFYCSFKYGTFEGERMERYYLDQTESSILSYIKDTGLIFALVNMSDDVRETRTDRWLNAVLVKTGA